jgi:stage II sporulation protein AA (anti-sigma F factor antagonist)
MAEPHFSLVKARVEQGVLVLTVTEAQVQSDSLADTLRAQLLTALAHYKAHKVVLNLQQVKALSSSGIRPLLSLRRHLEEKGGQLVLCGLTPSVASVLQTTRLISTSRSSSALFESQPDVAAAITKLSGTIATA